jgi:hypothetical protein
MNDQPSFISLTIKSRSRSSHGTAKATADSGELLNRGVLVGKMHLLLDAASESALNGRDGKHIAKQK